MFDKGEERNTAQWRRFESSGESVGSVETEQKSLERED
jgi:hypothetical protein